MKRQNLTFDRKMIRFISGALTLSILLIAIIILATTFLSVSKKSVEMAEKTAEVYSRSIKNALGNYLNISLSLMLDANIQKYLKEDEDYFAVQRGTKRMLDSICNMDSEINYLYLVSAGKSLAAGKGNPHWIKDFDKKLAGMYDTATDTGKFGVKMQIVRDVADDRISVLNIYCPVYSSTKIGGALGFFCFNIRNNSILQILKEENEGIKNFLTDKDFKLIVGSDSSYLSERMKKEVSDGKNGVSMDGSGLLIVKKVHGWELYFISKVYYWEILKNSVYTIGFLIIMVVLLLIFLNGKARRFVTSAYEPWRNLRSAMEEVTGGNMKVRLSEEEKDPDVELIVGGFNTMMNQIEHLILQIESEQNQKLKLQMESLQSQIQPHFLYNTLDCIRWKAVAGDMKDVSNMIKALAAYYRVCLSKGKDIISIQNEMEYLKNYLYIQNIRYENSIDYEMKADPESLEFEIPKLTLQPLVENAIYHGIKPGKEKGKINIMVRAEEKIKILIEDNGRETSDRQIEELNALARERKNDVGYGIRNVNRRIKLYFGEEYGIGYFRNVLGGVTAEITIPQHRVENKE